MIGEKLEQRETKEGKNNVIITGIKEIEVGGRMVSKGR
jgi:hypothetical protein